MDKELAQSTGQDWAQKHLLRWPKLLNCQPACVEVIRFRQALRDEGLHPKSRVFRQIWRAFLDGWVAWMNNPRANEE